MSADKSQLNELMIKMFENSTEAMFFFDGSGKAVAMNPAAEKILDVQALEQLKSGVDQAICGACKGYTSDAELQTCLGCYLSSTPAEDFSSFQVYLDTRGRGVIPYAATFHTIDAEQEIRVFMLRDLTTQFETQKKLHQNTLMKHVIKAQEFERKRISRELHDSVAQELLSALVDLRALKYMTTDPVVLEKTEETNATLTRLLDEIRNISVELRPAALDDFGLEAAFRSHFKRIDSSYGLEVRFVSALDKKRYENEIETVCYRVGQEALLNAVKYAQVGQVEVRLFEENEMLHLIVKDEGVGFRKGTNPIGTGLGLYGMNERAELLDGSVAIESEPGKGTTVHLRVPVRKEG
ncbi:sensor histidine kinase [Planococcus salinus]|uniref:Sensor histidine kinase n=1 Tax=Planococcus salinus TaxID=1848460 RepID=A0A3M8PC28_9BACL|nr:sensor histidine kinase [Planococcus salinus]RNF41172.1 sensor histidine kinase [Planococcus salinus]